MRTGWKYSRATRPSTDPTAKPAPSGDARTTRVWCLSDDSCRVAGCPASRLQRRAKSAIPITNVRSLIQPYTAAQSPCGCL